MIRLTKQSFAIDMSRRTAVRGFMKFCITEAGLIAFHLNFRACGENVQPLTRMLLSTPAASSAARMGRLTTVASMILSLKNRMKAWESVKGPN